MDFADLAKTIADQFVTVWDTPVPLITAGLIIWFLVRRYYASHFSGQLATKDDIIKLKEARLQDYQDKLSGATPDEARARIDALEARLHRLEPRKLNRSHQERLIKALSPFPGPVSIHADSTVPDAMTLFRYIHTSFHDAGWSVSGSQSSDLSYDRPSRSGFVVNVIDPNNLSEGERAFLNTFSEFGIEHEIRADEAGVLSIYITRPDPEA